MAHLINRESWSSRDRFWHGELEGHPFDAGVSLIFNILRETGGGPRLHQHPYAETFIVRAGSGLFTVGSEKITAQAGQILVVPANTPHKFTNLGHGPLETIDIHASDRFVTTWLE
jgi:mannose-6-phosphate isomerase-like protein (cupin superfamily)